MSASNEFETALLNLIFNNTDIPNIGDAGGLQNSAAPGSLYLSLHTADPAEPGEQTDSETAYTNYARVAVARSGAGWTVAGNSVSNAAVVNFATCGVTGATLTHFGVGTDAAAGSGMLLFSGALAAPLIVSAGIAPSFAIGALTVTAD